MGMIDMNPSIISASPLSSNTNQKCLKPNDILNHVTYWTTVEAYPAAQELWRIINITESIMMNSPFPWGLLQFHLQWRVLNTSYCQAEKGNWQSDNDNMT